MRKKVLLWTVLLLVFIINESSAKNSTYTFVIVHGAWGGSWDWKKVDSLLTNKGHNVYRVNLSGLGHNFHTFNKDIDLNTHILDVVNFMQFENLSQVILLGHSYGGMVITGAAELIPDRIKELIYLDALLPNDGESLITAFADKNKDSVETAYIVENKNDSLIYPYWVKDETPFPKDVPQPLKTFLTKININNPLVVNIPGIYILTIDKNKIPEEDRFYKFYLRAKNKNYRLVEMKNTSHIPERENPNELVNLILKNINL